MIIVSACLIGIKCKYNGSDNSNPALIDLMKKGSLLPLCPEQLGGLSTPRKPAEILNDKVYNISGKNITHNFIKGSLEALHIARMANCTKAIFKDCSPSCGVNRIYNGKHENVLIEGEGMTTALFRKNGIKVLSESEIEKAGII